MITLRTTWADYIETRPLKPKTLTDHWSKLNRGCGDWIDLDMNTITKSMIAQRHRKLSEHPTNANCTMRIVRTLYNHAIATFEDDNEDPLIKRNPVVKLSQARAWNKEHPRDRHIPLNKMRTWVDAVLMMSNPTMRDYLLTLVLTGLRKTEAATLEWQHIDLSEGFLFVPDTKNGTPHKLPLSRLLAGTFQDRAKDRVNEYVFPGGRHRDDSYLKSPYKAIAPLIAQTGIKFSPHDLRRTFLLVAEDINIEEFIRKRLVNHTFSDVTGKHYSVKNPEKLREPMERISQRVLELAELN